MLFYQLFIFLLIFFISIYKIHTIVLPLAPFQIKIQCKNGLSNGINGPIKKKEICPASSTSCAYIEIPIKNDKISVYECVDESILSGEDDDEEVAKHKLFSQMCDHIPKCQLLNSSLLNPSFKKYLSTTYKLPLMILLNKKLLFCCSMNSAVLEKIVQSKDKSQKLLTSSLIKCNTMTCGNGAIGCLSYQKFRKAKIIDGAEYINDEDSKDMTEYNYDDYNNIEDIKIEFNNEFDQNYRKKRDINEKEYQCVYPHLNDEVYRYCTMIYSNSNNNNRCYKEKDFEICCCYVRPNLNTCEPGEKELPPTITLPPKTVKNNLKLKKQNKSKIINYSKSKDKGILNSYKKSTNKISTDKILINKKCKFVTKQKMRRLQNDRIVPYFYKLEVCSSSKNLISINIITIFIFYICYSF